MKFLDEFFAYIGELDPLPEMSKLFWQVLIFLAVVAFFFPALSALIFGSLDSKFTSQCISGLFGCFMGAAAMDIAHQVECRRKESALRKKG
jgi:hypothetical protein